MLSKKSLPLGYSIENEEFDWGSSPTKHPYFLIGILLLLNFIICSILFENMKLALIVVLTVPLSFMGVFLMFLLFDYNFDQGGYASFVLLGGIVVNSAIFLVNDFKRNDRTDLMRNQKLITAFSNRARTVTLTILSTCTGMVPFLIGGQREVFWFSLAIGTVGGLIIAFFALFIALPVFLWETNS